MKPQKEKKIAMRIGNTTMKANAEYPQSKHVVGRHVDVASLNSTQFAQSSKTASNFVPKPAMAKPIHQTANKALKSQILQADEDSGDMYFDTFLAMVENRGHKEMYDRLDDVIHQYTRAMVGRLDDFTADTIGDLRIIRDIFRMPFDSANTTLK